MILAVDIGSSRIKAGVFRDSGSLLRFAAYTYKKDTFEEWYRGFLSLVRTLNGPDLEGLIISGQSPTLLALDQNYRLLPFTSSWYDKREIPLPVPSSSYFLPKVRWIQKKDPLLYRQIRLFTGCPDYISFLLTGRALTLLPSAAYRPYFWEKESLPDFFDPALFPDEAFMGERIGSVTPEAGRKTGLKAGLPVLAGGIDFVFSLLGSGTIRPGTLCNRIGTSETLNYCTASAEGSFFSIPHPIPPYRNIPIKLLPFGSLLEYYRRQAPPPLPSYKELLGRLADRSRALSSEQQEPEPAQRHPEANTSEEIKAFLRSSPAPLPPATPASYEEKGVWLLREQAERLKQAFTDLEKTYPLPSVFTVSGQMAAYPFWSQFRADITGRSVEEPRVYDTEILGSACVALTGLGAFSSLTEAVQKMYRVKALYHPGSRLS